MVEISLREAAQLLSQVDSAKPNNAPGSRRDRVEYGLVLCYIPGKQELKPIFARGQIDQIDLGGPVVACYKQGGKPVLIAHTHPRSAAIPSMTDVTELIRAIDRGLVDTPLVYCIARRGEKYVFNCVVLRSREDAVKLAVATAECHRRASAQNPVPRREDPLLTEEEAQL